MTEQFRKIVRHLKESNWRGDGLWNFLVSYAKGNSNYDRESAYKEYYMTKFKELKNENRKRPRKG